MGPAGSGGRAGIGMKKLRTVVQIAFTIFTNGYAYGFLNGKIYQGSLKYACVPGLNCYSCPGAVAACPLGALQALLNRRGFQVPFAMLGFFFLFGSVFGRFICGWLCPFGLVQDLLHKIPLFRKRKRLPFHHILKYGRYAALVGPAGIGSLFLFGGFAKVPAFCKYLCPSGTFFGALPLMASNEALRGQAGGLFFWKLGILLILLLLSVKVYRPFCQYLCPAGTLGGGIPLLLTNPSLRQAAGALFQWKALVLAAVVSASAVIHRPFCKYLCPLGAFYALFNRFSFYQMHLDKDKCVGCGKCERSCPMDVEVTKNINSPECIRCGKCRSVCPAGAVSSGFACGAGSAAECGHQNQTEDSP